MSIVELPFSRKIGNEHSLLKEGLGLGPCYMPQSASSEPSKRSGVPKCWKGGGCTRFAVFTLMSLVRKTTNPAEPFDMGLLALSRVWYCKTQTRSSHTILQQIAFLNLFSYLHFSYSDTEPRCRIGYAGVSTIWLVRVLLLHAMLQVVLQGVTLQGDALQG